ncbi:MAG TPA: MFS transporter [Proteiniclasticum sp.]|nr:MFS transporter [Proteiniclasticum sp.]
MVKEKNLTPNHSGSLPLHWKRNTIIFLSSQAISLFGSSLVQYAILWYITLTTNSGIMLTLSTLFGFMPQLIISIFAGVWADRYDRKKLIILSDLGIATSTFILAIIFLSGYRGIEALFVVSFIRSVGAGIQTPSVSAMLPQIVPKEKLMKVNGINSSVQSIMMLLSPALSALLLTYSDLPVIFFIDVITAILAIILLMILSVSPHKQALSKKQDTYLSDLKNGIKYASGNRFIAALILAQLILSFLVAPIAMLTPLLVARSYGEEYWRLTINEISFFGGTIVGGFLIVIWQGFKNKVRTFSTSLTVLGLLTLFMGMTDQFALYIIAMTFIGLVIPYFNAPIITLLQENVPEDKLGRVFSLINASSMMIPLGMLLYGPLAEVVSIESILVVTGFLMMIQSLFIFRNKRLLDYHEQDFE